MNIGDEQKEMQEFFWENDEEKKLPIDDSKYIKY